MYRSYETYFITTYVENSNVSNLVSVWKGCSKFSKRTKLSIFHGTVPMLKRGFGVGVLLSKFVKPFSSDNVH